VALLSLCVAELALFCVWGGPCAAADQHQWPLAVL